MLNRKGKKWVLYPHKVFYTDNGEGVEQWATPSKEWWTETEIKHSRIEIEKFEEVELSKEKIDRYEEIKDMPDDHKSIYEEYILTGDTSNDQKIPKLHPFNILRLNQEDSSLGQSVTDSELQSIQQGQEITDMDLRITVLEAE